MAVEGVVGLPRLSELVLAGIAAAVDAVEVGVALGCFQEGVVAVGSCFDGGITAVYGTGGAVAVEIVGGGGLFPDGGEAFVVDWAHLVDAAQGTVGLHTAGVVVAGKEPLEVTADTGAVFKGHAGKAVLEGQQGGEVLLAVLCGAVQADGAPGTVFAVEQLVRACQLLGVCLGTAAVGAAPVLYDVPVGALAAVAGGDETLRRGGGVEAADEFGALLGEVAWQHTLVLQAPENDAGRVAPLTHPPLQQTEEIGAELRCVVPDMGGELAPEEHALLVEELLVEQVVGLVGLAEGIEAGQSYLLHP